VAQAIHDRGRDEIRAYSELVEDVSVLKEIAASLPEVAALVAFVRYARHGLKRPGAGKDATTPVRRGSSANRMSGCWRKITCTLHPGRMGPGMPGEPHSGSKLWDALDPKIGESGKDRGRIVAHRKFQSAAALHDRENRRNQDPHVGCRCVSSFFDPEPRDAWNSPPG